MDNPWVSRGAWMFAGATVLVIVGFIITMWQEQEDATEPSEMVIPSHISSETSEARIVEIPAVNARVVDTDALDSLEEKLSLLQLLAEVPAGSTKELAFLENDQTRVLVVMRSPSGQETVFEVRNLTNTGLARRAPLQLAAR